ncbi:carbohydrate binding family 9 domain-containing protein, partial [bacterium]|nr:carbohydrate binding family 9 domain-containing protein [bacterium]
MRKLLLIIFITFFVQAQTEVFNPEDYRNREVTAIRLEEPLNIDGLLDEALYSTKANDSFVQYEPNNGIPGSEDTEFWVGYDDNALYIGAIMYDSNPDSIIARMTRRDGGEASDMLYIGLDSYYDQRSGFWFSTNPVGSISDGTISNDNNTEDSWDGIWDSQSKITEKGWSTEIKIPFSQLRFNKAPENIMGIGLIRQIHRRKEMDFFTYIARDESGLASHFATLRGIKNIQPPKRLELTPYITGNHGNLKSAVDNPFINGKDSY